jgi:ATP-dependent RNA helicase RhlE
MSYSYRSKRNGSYSGQRNRRYSNQRKNNNRGTSGEYIDPSRFIQTAKITETEAYEPQHQFNDFELDALLKANLAHKGYVTPSPIQDQTIPAGLAGKDIIGIASTGTGKTAAFALPLLHKLINDKASAAIIIAPTRELAQQIEQECKALAKGSGLFGVLLIGGTAMGSQLRSLKNNPRVVIGTPGRIKDHLQRGTLKLNRFNVIVLDEVDRMLDMGFVHDVRDILNEASENRQSFFFSATIDPRVRALIDTFTHEPYTVSLKASATSENVHQDVVRFNHASEKVDKLHDVLLQDKVTKVIVFDETQRSVEKLNKELVNRGFAAEAIHGGKTQGQRQRALSKFKANDIDILVATDVAARGIDVADISHVINFSIPRAYDDYIHRIGRAGRAGQIGYALTFVSEGRGNHADL